MIYNTEWEKSHPCLIKSYLQSLINKLYVTYKPSYKGMTFFEPLEKINSMQI